MMNFMKPKEPKKKWEWSLGDEFYSTVDGMKTLSTEDVEERKRTIIELCDLTELELNRAKLAKEKAEAKFYGFKTVMDAIGTVVNPVAVVMTVVLVTATAKSNIIPKEGMSLFGEVFKSIVKK